MYTTAYLSEREVDTFESYVRKGCLDISRPKMSVKEEKKVLPFYQDSGYGFSIGGKFSLDAFKSALGYKPRPDDLFIVTYPKCGTTWVQNIVGCIYRDGKPFSTALEFLSNTPFLELTGAKAAETMQRPGAIKMHLPFHLTPWSPQAKYIFVARNPKDCCVSFYHHTRNIVGYYFQDGKFDDFFELFIEGKVDFGDYFDTLISWYEHRNDPNVLFITYEQLKKDTKTYVLKIAEFMGEKYKDMLIKDESLLNDVIKHSSFDFMKDTLNRQMSELAALPQDFILNHPDIPQGLKKLLTTKDGFFDSDPDSVTFVRKGIVGDFKNYFSAEQNRRLEEKFRERTKGTDLPELWKDIIEMSVTVKEDGNKSSRKVPLYQVVDGWRLPSAFSPDAYRSALAYNPRPDDLFIVSFPKCGTTWVQSIVSCIYKNGKPFESAVEFLTQTPFLEMSGAEAANTMRRPGPLKVHLPFHRVPWSPKAKYIFVARNPKDCCVSFYHFTKNIPVYNFEEASFDDFFELFINGQTDYGEYFDTVMSWYEHKNDPNVLFITYEELKKDTIPNILKIAGFMGSHYKEHLESDEKLLRDVIHHSSFTFMKEHLNKYIAEFQSLPREMIRNNPDLPQGIRELFGGEKDVFSEINYVRKGTVGDWKNYFSPEQSARLEKKFKEIMGDTDLAEMWKDIM